MWLPLALALYVLLLWQRKRHFGLSWPHYLSVQLVHFYVRTWHGGTSCGRKLPHKGPAIVVANHTCSADPGFLQLASPRPLGFVIAREFYLARWVNRLFVSIGCVPV